MVSPPLADALQLSTVRAEVRENTSTEPDWPIGEIGDDEKAIKEQLNESQESEEDDDQDMAGPTAELLAQNDSAASGVGSGQHGTGLSGVKSPGPPDEMQQTSDPK